MNQLKLLYYLLFICLISACSLIYPTYNKPKIDLAGSWSANNLNLNAESNLAYLAWWHSFNDPTLNQLLESGLTNNNQLKIAYANLGQAEGQLRGIELSWIPGISLLGGYSTNPAFGSPGSFYGVYPGYFNINVFNQLARQKSAKLQVLRQRYIINATKLVLIGQTTKAYYTLLAQKYQAQLYTEYIQDLSNYLEILQQSFETGLDSLLPVEQTRAKLYNIKAKQQIIAENIIHSQNAIRYLINQNPGPIITKINFKQVNTYRPDFIMQKATILSQRPDVNLAETEYKLAVQNKAVNYTNLLPSIQLDAFAGRVNLSNNNLTGNYGEFSDAYLNWSVSPSVFGNIKAYNSQEKAAYYNYIDTVRKALHDTDNDLYSHYTANNRYRDLVTDLTALKKRYLLNSNLYQATIISYLTKLSAKLDVDVKEIELTQIKLLQMLSLIQLYQDLGGGYQLIRAPEKEKNHE